MVRGEFTFLCLVLDGLRAAHAALNFVAKKLREEQLLQPSKLARRHAHVTHSAHLKTFTVSRLD